MVKLRIFLPALVLLATAFASHPASAQDTDCPQARDRYSSRSVLMDLLIDPRTRAILDDVLGSSLKRYSLDMLAGPPPSSTAIITPKELLSLNGIQGGDAILARLDARLKTVELTRTAMVARCARYDRTPPTVPSGLKRPALLVFDKITGFRDGPSVDAATAALKDIARRRGWSIFFSSNGAIMNRRDLAKFDAVVWNNVSGDVLTVPQRAAFRAYVEQGGGYAGIHGSGGDPIYHWTWYADTLVGARFIAHTNEPHYQEARVVVDDRSSAITRGLGDGWTMTEEWYSFRESPRKRGAHVLVTIDESTYKPIGFGGMDIHMGDHPLAWTRCVGNGRSFYTAIGHIPENYAEPNSARLLEQGVAWAMGSGGTRCRNGAQR